MIAFRGRRVLLARRLYAFAASAFLVLSSASYSSAGFIVGTASGNDNHADVLAVILDYNAGPQPDLPTDFELFKKTDPPDTAFVFNLANGFKFYNDAALTMQIFTEGELLTLPEAYFTYDGPENLLYYSDKSGSRFSVWTYMPGANHIDIPGFGNEISHVSFWKGTSGPVDVPEPSTLAIVGCGLVGLLLFRANRLRN